MEFSTLHKRSILEAKLQTSPVYLSFEIRIPFFFP